MVSGSDDVSLQSETRHVLNRQHRHLSRTVIAMSGATIGQGAKSGGKIYFDVTGQTPARVVYKNGVQDLLIWER